MGLIKMILIFTDFTVVAHSSKNFESLFTLSGNVGFGNKTYKL